MNPIILPVKDIIGFIWQLVKEKENSGSNQMYSAWIFVYTIVKILDLCVRNP